MKKKKMVFSPLEKYRKPGTGYPITMKRETPCQFFVNVDVWLH